MFIFTIEEASYLGEPDETYGRTVWAKVKEDSMPVMFNTKHESPIEGRQIVAEEKIMKKSSKGTNYWRLKKVKIGEPVNTLPFEDSEPPSKPAHKEVTNEEIMAKLLEIETTLNNFTGNFEV